jgi:hypothetical protein
MLRELRVPWRLLTTREITAAGFGFKRRDWNAKAELLNSRQQWAELGNEHLARAELDLRIASGATYSDRRDGTSCVW